VSIHDERFQERPEVVGIPMAPTELSEVERHLRGEWVFSGRRFVQSPGKGHKPSPYVVNIKLATQVGEDQASGTSVEVRHWRL
jgi:hypothetical protein